MYNAVDGDVDLVKVDQQVRLIESYHHHVMIWSASRLVACKPRPTSKLGHCQVTARFLRSITPRDKYRSPPPPTASFLLWHLLQLPTVVTATIVGHCHVCCSTNLHSSRRSCISSCWTTVVEQPSVQPTAIRPYPSAVPPGVERRICLVYWDSST